MYLPVSDAGENMRVLELQQYGGFVFRIRQDNPCEKPSLGPVLSYTPATPNQTHQSFCNLKDLTC